MGCRSTPQAKPQPIPEPLFSLTRSGELPRAITLGLAESRGYLFIPTHVNRQPAGLFLVDTGAGLSVVDTGVIGRLRLPEVGEGTAMGVAGSERFAWHQLESLSFGDVVQLPDQRAAGLSMHRLTGGTGTPAGGIIGYPSLAQVPFSLDFRAKKLTLYQPASFRPPADAKPIPLIRGHGTPVVDAVLHSPEGAHRIRLIIDTGADHALALPMEVKALWPGIVATPAQGRIQARGVGGVLTGTGTWVRRLDVLGVALTDVPVQFEPRPRGKRATHIPTGRIGHALLRDFHLSFDQRNGKVHAAFLPAREAPRPNNASDANQ